MLENLKLLGATLARMEYSSDRQKLIANNIAHANTPNYKGKDLKPFSLTDGPLMQRATRPEHLNFSENASPYGYTTQAAGNTIYDQSLNKNQVSLEEEMVKAAEAQSSHQLAAGVWQRSIALLRMSVANGR